MKVLVTGATGFIGSHLAEELSKRGYDVTCLVRKPSRLKWLEGLDLAFKEGDCLDADSLTPALKGADAVFHLAGLTKGRRPDDFYRANTAGTENMLKAAEKACPDLKRFVFMSSLSAVGPSRNGRPVDEETEPKPVSDYGKSKLKAEAAVLKYSAGMPITIIRPPAVYGPRDRDFYFFYKLLKKGIFPYWGECRYSLIYVDDLVKGLIQAVESPGAGGGTFFLSDGNIYTNVEIADRIAQAVGSRPLRLRVPGRLLGLIAGAGGWLSSEPSVLNRDKARELCHSNWLCDSSRAVKRLGFSPKTMLKEGVSWTANWYRIHRWL